MADKEGFYRWYNFPGDWTWVALSWYPNSVTASFHFHSAYALCRVRAQVRAWTGQDGSVVNVKVDLSFLVKDNFPDASFICFDIGYCEASVIGGHDLGKVAFGYCCTWVQWLKLFVQEYDKRLWMSLTSYLILYSLLPWVLALGRVHWARREAVPCWPWLRNVHAAVPEHNFWIRSRFKKRCLPAEVWNWSAVLGIKVVNPRLWHGSCPSISIPVGICFFLSWNHHSQMKLSAKHKIRILWSGWCQT